MVLDMICCLGSSSFEHVGTLDILGIFKVCFLILVYGLVNGMLIESTESSKLIDTILESLAISMVNMLNFNKVA